MSIFSIALLKKSTASAMTIPNPTVKFALRAGTALKRSPLPSRWASLNSGEFNKMKNAKPLLIALIAALLGGCATLPPTSTQSADIAKYRFVVIEATPTVSSISGSGGNLSTREINPANLIEGLLLKIGLVRVATVGSGTQEQALLLRWGISGRRDIPLVGYTQEVTILLLDAHSQQSVYKCTAEGFGSTEADDIREAITSCLSGLK